MRWASTVRPNKRLLLSLGRAGAGKGTLLTRLLRRDLFTSAAEPQVVRRGVRYRFPLTSTESTEPTMSGSRIPPHESISAAMAVYLLEADGRYLAETGGHALSGDFDPNLVVIFNSLAQRTAEHAFLRYYWANETPEGVLDTLGRATLAMANMFRLLAPEGGLVQVEWQGRRRSVPSIGHMDLQHAGKVRTALLWAILTGRRDDSELLAGLDENEMTHPQIIQTPLGLDYTKFLQHLSRGAESAVDDLREGILAQLPEGDDPDSRFTWAEYRLFLSIPGGEQDQIAALLDDYLGKHRTLFDNDRNNMRVNMLGLVSLAGAAAIVLSRRRNIHVEVASPYIPDDLLTEAIRRDAAH